MDIQTVKAQHDIVQIIERTIPLKKQGQTYSGLCPFHDDSIPSLKVYPGQQTFCCYGCGHRGDVIDWIALSLNVEFKTALSVLSGIPEYAPKPLFEKRAKRFKTISHDAARYWHDKLGKRRTYFHNRGFSDDTIDRELFGFDGRRFVIPIWVGFPQESLLAAVKLRRDDQIEKQRLSDNGLTGEQIDNALRLTPKYLLRGSYEPLLYNKWRIQNEETVFVFFGEFDCQLASQLGLPSCSPVHGANSWQKSWEENELRYAREIIIIPDRNERLPGFLTRSLLGGHAQVFQWPGGDFGDFSDYILQGGTIGSFLELCNEQGLTSTYLV